MKTQKDPKKLDQLLQEMKQDYLEALPKKIVLLEKLTKEKNWDQINTEYHKLKGTGKTYGFPEISKISEHLESLSAKKETQITMLFDQATQLLRDIVDGYNANKPINLSKHAIAKTILNTKIG